MCKKDWQYVCVCDCRLCSCLQPMKGEMFCYHIFYRQLCEGWKMFMYNNRLDESYFCRTVTHLLTVMKKWAGLQGRIWEQWRRRPRENFLLAPWRCLKRRVSLCRRWNTAERLVRGGKRAERLNMEDRDMAWVALGLSFHITLFLTILKTGCATENDGIMLGATAPGDFIIGGIFPIHEDVAKKYDSFAPQPQPCVRWDNSDQGFKTVNLFPLSYRHKMNRD